jgi:murein L,D-transpeptidase YcbB/YkuD
MRHGYSAGGLRPPARLPLFSGCLAALALATVSAPALSQPYASASYASPQQVQAEIRSKLDRKLKPVYKARGYRPLWVEGGRPGPAADRLLELLASAELDGLDPGDYDVDDLSSLVERARGGSPEALARAEVELSEAYVDYVRDVRRPTGVRMSYVDESLEPERPSAAAVLQAAAAAPSLARYLDDGLWVNPIYAGLRRGLLEHHRRWAGLPSIAIPAGPTLRPGSKGDRVQLLRARLGVPGGSSFDQALADKVRAFQADHALPVDALVGPTTIAALNRGTGYHEQLIRLNMERARALPANPNGRHIVVDAGAARLWLYENGRPVDTMKVIVGKPGQPTPMFAGLMRFVAINPYWNVPPDLVRDNIAPRVLEDPSYLERSHYEALSDWTANARKLDPDEVDWHAVASGQRTLRVRQLPGAGNAMGKMKFMFPNEYGVYLHDTPDRHLFKDDERRFSSGCVRLEDAQRLAKWLFGRPLDVPAGGTEQHVNLANPVPVYITYLTAAPTETGIAFRADAYDRDAAQLAEWGGRSFAAAR